MARAVQDSASLAYPHSPSSSAFSANPSNPPCPLHIDQRKTGTVQSIREFRRRACLPITLHGDASFVGQGVVTETLNLETLPSYGCEGVVHVIVNNQIGFTSDNSYAKAASSVRSSHSSASPGFAFGMPVIHVNTQDVEAVSKVFRLAQEYRAKFGRSIILNCVGTRLMGHNEQDDPSITSPNLYQAIDASENIVAHMKHHMDPTMIDAFERDARSFLEAEMAACELARNTSANVSEEEAVVQSKNAYLKQNSLFKSLMADALQEGVEVKSTADVGDEAPSNAAPSSRSALPLAELRTAMQAKHSLLDAWGGGGEMGALEAVAGVLHKRVLEVLKTRRACLALDGEGDGQAAGKPGGRKGGLGLEAGGLDWAAAEALAFTSLLHRDKVGVRLCGQDVERGTFNQRHLVWNNQQTGEKLFPLTFVAKGSNAHVCVANSPVSEASVLGFMYGYSVMAESQSRRNLTIWEAQFGDFVNTAQWIVDNIIAQGEAKWGTVCGLVILLPHASEGAGPEHSSGKLERWLQLVCDDPDAEPGTSPFSMKQIATAFRAADHDDSGEISRQEAGVFLAEALHVSEDSALVERLIERMDENGDGQISFEEWRNFSVAHLQANPYANLNLTITQPSTPAQYFHLLRLQALSQHSPKPLVVMTPKSLLHSPLCRSHVSALTQGTFKPVLSDPLVEEIFAKHASDVTQLEGSKELRHVTKTEGMKEQPRVTRIVFCTGHFYYAMVRRRKIVQRQVTKKRKELAAAGDKGAAGGPDEGLTAVVRLEQLSPFPYKQIQELLRSYTAKATDSSSSDSEDGSIHSLQYIELIWAQEEPKNQGAYAYVSPRLRTAMRSLPELHVSDIRYVGRGPSATAAGGSTSFHQREQSEIADEALLPNWMLS